MRQTSHGAYFNLHERVQVKLFNNIPLFSTDVKFNLWGKIG